MNENNRIPIFFIVLDTLRKDYADILEKSLNKYNFYIYENAISPSPWTIPSHASIFTGLYPAFHKIHESKYKKGMDIRFNPTKLELLEYLNNKGYKSYLLSANTYITPYFGIKNFHRFIDLTIPPFIGDEKQDIVSHIVNKTNRNKIEIIKNILKSGSLSFILEFMIGYTIKKMKWPLEKGSSAAIYHLKKILEQESLKNNIFVFMNLMEMHEPYSKGENLPKLLRNNRMGHIPPSSKVKKWKNRYAVHSQYLTDKVLKIIDIIRNFDIFEKSLIIITSDHGQLLGEHNILGHGTYLYDELLKVPLLIKYPENIEISIKDEKEYDKCYISLTALRNFIIETVNNRKINDSILYAPTVFAESYGIPEKVNPQTKKEKEHVNLLEKYRIAVYSQGSKAIFNVTDWKFENVDQPISFKLKKIIVNFLNLATSSKVLE